MPGKTGTHGAAVAAPFALIGFCGGVAGAALVAHAQGPGPKPVERRIAYSNVPAQMNPTQLLRHMVKAGQNVSFKGREETLNESGVATEQWVTWDPRLGLRRDSIRPESGDIYLDDFQHAYLYSQRERKWTEQNSLLPKPSGRIKDVLTNISQGNLHARWVGQDTVANRIADIVLITPAGGAPEPTRRVWIDRASGIRLKSEDIGPSGRILSSAYYLSVDLAPQIDVHDFEPPTASAAAPAIEHVEKQTFHTLDAATHAGYALHTPTFLPPGFTLRVIDVNKNNGRITQRYSNGLTLVSIVEFAKPFGPRIVRQLGSSGSAFVAGPNGRRSFLWRDSVSSRCYAILSAIPEDQIRRIADSIH